METLQSRTRPDDRYPSRVGDEAAILEREDPVVYGRAGDGPLPQAQLDFFARHGYLFFPGHFDASEVARFRREMTRIWDQRQQDTSDEVIREPESEVIRSVFRIHETSPVYDRVCRDPRLLGIAQQILGSGVYIHHSRINYKPGYAGKEFYWHSDFETWHTEDGIPAPRGLSISISLTENNEHNGPLMVIPGSHKAYVSCPGATPKENYRRSLRRQEHGVPDTKSLDYLMAHRSDELTSATGPAGSVLIFDANIMHGSNSNISPYPRSVLYFVYNSVENTPGEPYNGLEPRPEFLRSTSFAPLTPAMSG